MTILPLQGYVNLAAAAWREDLAASHGYDWDSAACADGSADGQRLISPVKVMKVERLQSDGQIFTASCNLSCAVK